MLEKRRNRNAYFAMPLAYDATDAYRDARALAQTVATGLRILALAETEWIQIHYNNWLPEDSTPHDYDLFEDRSSVRGCNRKVKRDLGGPER